MLEEMGFSRVVLARECSKEEIREIIRSTSLEVETCLLYTSQHVEHRLGVVLEDGEQGGVEAVAVAVADVGDDLSLIHI